MTIAADHHLARPFRINVTKVQAFFVSMIFISSFLAKFEPAPTDLFVVISVLCCIGSGLAFSRAMAPLFGLLLIYNLSGLFSYTLIPDDQLDSKIYIIGLALTSLSGIFIAAYITADPLARYHQIVKAYWVGATIGAILGLCSYFKIEPVYSVFPDFAGRALGGYKDPNVFSTWLVFPAVTMLQGFVLGSLRIRPVSVISFIFIFAALFLAFSRGAWINAVMATGITLVFTFALSPTSALRWRISTAAVLGILFLGIALAVMLSIPETRDLFLDRFTLVKSYDAGETGRFGNQINSVPILMQLPFGFGPYQWNLHFNQAPHNTFLNSFASAGWLGGVSYFVLIISDIIVGFRTMFVRTPFQPFAISVFACLLAVVLQGIQIDTEHWRHLYWMTGITWGFFAASLFYAQNPMPKRSIEKAWYIRN
jgi:O-Antigen ligase